MELSFVRDGAGRDQQVRLKLHFEDATILTAQQIQEGLQDSWFLLGGHLHSIADLASQIEGAFGLRSSCPHGVFLRMDYFTLPPSQPIGLLKDKDTVSIHRKQALVFALQQQGGSYIDSFEKVAPLYIKDNATGEFEKTGRSQSEEEERDFKERLAEDDDNKALKLPSIDLQDQRRIQKRERRKSKKIPRMETYTNFYEHAATDAYDKDLEKGIACAREKKRNHEEAERHSNKENKSRKKKIQRLENHEYIGEDLQEIRKMQDSCGKAAKVKDIKKLLIPTVPTDNDEHAIKTNATTATMYQSKKDIPVFASSTDDKMQNKEDSSQQCIDHEIVKKCSRSTLRKKAKRRWKRENLDLLKKGTSQAGSGLLRDENADRAKSPSIVSSKHEDDGDAEEERLPRVVRPGHIRFQDSDEDGSPGVDPNQNSLHHIGWSLGISKRKGQNWGQEKTKWSHEKSEAVLEMERGNIQEFEPEALPVVEGIPQVGNVIAFRLLSLSPSCCPELSEYRVGRVVEVDSQSGQLKIARISKYRICGDGDLPVDGGVIETEISSLAEVRLVECSELGSTEMPGDEVERNVCIVTEMPGDEVERNVSIVTDIKTDISQNGNVESIVTETEPQVGKSDSAPFEGWLEITDAIQRKRDELGRQAEANCLPVANHEHGETIENEHQPDAQDSECATSNGTEEKRNGLEFVNKDESRPATSSENKTYETYAVDSKTSSAGKLADGAPAGRVRGWQRRAGGLGSTIALLRSQNTML